LNRGHFNSDAKQNTCPQQELRRPDRMTKAEGRNPKEIRRPNSESRATPAVELVA
jgi:hypothetical protein